MFKSIAIVLFAAACVSAKLSSQEEEAINKMLGKWIEPMVVGGEDAERGEFPHMIQLQYYDSHMCGASIIKEDWVLTAAHCVDGETPSSLKLVAGQHSLIGNDNTEQYGEIEEIIVHPKYGSHVFDFDIAVLKLKNKYTFNENVGKIELFKDSDLPKGGKAKTSGWGRLSAGGAIPDILQKLTVNLYEDSVCEEAYGTDTFTPNMVCAGNIEGGHCVCNGDSGSPLYIEDGGKKQQVGIVSWGRPCANAGYPAAYTEVGAFIDFVQQHVPGL